MEAPVLLTRHISSLDCTKEALNEQSQMAWVIAFTVFRLLYQEHSPTHFTPPHLYVCVCGSSSFQPWWTSCHSSSPCRWRASRRCASSCEPAASAVRRSSSRSPRRRTWTCGRSWEPGETKQTNSVFPVHTFFHLQRPTRESDRATANRFPTLMLTALLQDMKTLLSTSQLCLCLQHTQPVGKTTWAVIIYKKVKV